LVLLDIDSDEWNAAICAYLQANIKRGMPSLGEDLSALFLIGSPFDEKELLIAKDPVDIKNNATYKKIVNIVDGFIESLEQKSTFPDSDEVQAPSSLLWAWYLRASLHEMVGEYSEGMAIADKCLEQTPTGVDLYEQKARLIMGAGDTHAALAQLEKGRQLDLQDRYINNLTVKYLMKADKRDEALEKMALFTRHESDPEQNIFDMQVTWYELELAASFERNNQIGKSLKKYSKFALT
jgi:tetratricopeptide (TPR) repeat protein